MKRGLLILIKFFISCRIIFLEFLQKFFSVIDPSSGRRAIVADPIKIEIFELIFVTIYSTEKKKLESIQKTSAEFDLLKFFLQVSWEIKILDDKKYILLSKSINEIGKMLGGWQKQLLTKTPPVAENKAIF